MPTAPAGMISESILRYFCRSDIETTSDDQNPAEFLTKP
jgi:hypothetical protein